MWPSKLVDKEDVQVDSVFYHPGYFTLDSNHV